MKRKTILLMVMLLATFLALVGVTLYKTQEEDAGESPSSKTVYSKTKTRVVPVAKRTGPFAPRLANRNETNPIAEELTDLVLPAVKMRICSTKGSAVLKEGETLVVGGWASKSGKRTWGFVRPTVQPGNGQLRAVVHLTARFVEIPDGMLKNPEWEALKSSDDTNNKAGVLAPGGFEELMKSWADQEEVEDLSAPAVSVFDGSTASIQVGQLMETNANATTHEVAIVGIALEFQPTVNPSDKTVALDVSITIGQ